MAAARRGPLLGPSLAICKTDCGSGSSDMDRIAVWMLVKPPGGLGCSTSPAKPSLTQHA